MQTRLRAFSLFRWCVTVATALLVMASALSMVYHFGVIKTVPYPNGNYAPISTDIAMLDGGFLYTVTQGMTDVRRDSPYLVIGTHWTWMRNPRGFGGLWWTPSVHPGWIQLPAPVLIGPPVVVTLCLWVPLLVRRLRRKAFECVCGYDRRGLAPASPCPECGAFPNPP